MAKYKEQAKSTGNPFAAAAAAPAAAAAAEPVPNILDLFGMSDGGAAPAAAAVNTSGGSDLLQLSGNPFANIVNQAGSTGGAANNSASTNAALNNGMYTH